MDRLISCEFNMDNACVELKFANGSMIAIDTIAVENEIADNMYQRSELDYLIYNAPLEYADLILNGDPETTRMEKDYDLYCYQASWRSWCAEKRQWHDYFSRFQR